MPLSRLLRIECNFTTENVIIGRLKIILILNNMCSYQLLRLVIPVGHCSNPESYEFCHDLVH